MHGGQVHAAAGEADVAAGEVAGTLVAVEVEAAPAKKRSAAQLKADSAATTTTKKKPERV